MEILAAVPATMPSAARQLDHPLPGGVPGHHRVGQPQPPGEGGGDRRSVAAERRERSRGATELAGQPHAGVGQRPAGIHDADQPSGGLEPERDRNRRL